MSKLFARYFDAEDTELNSAFGIKMLVAAVRRVRSPGAKFDTMVVLEGSQDSGKSTALKILAGDENFSDQPIIGSTRRLRASCCPAC
ncbi:VapE domain-containing protein [Paracoccus sp. TOH]|uniref:VapE domain-containing protein n=1 Tax=Paracoccus sp. TOH TaxID=1263728 RepID=UPI0025AF7EF3|nr:VapE domain-containing protein [Paracoccus sp. TOH]WJS84226.1 virulence-associated E family protein [Paracoccus sp. TOH]